MDAEALCCVCPALQPWQSCSLNSQAEGTLEQGLQANSLGQSGSGSLLESSRSCSHICMGQQTGGTSPCCPLVSFPLSDPSLSLVPSLLPQQCRWSLFSHGFLHKLQVGGSIPRTLLESDSPSLCPQLLQQPCGHSCFRG